MSECAVELDDLPQIDVDRAFAVLSWDLEEILNDPRVVGVEHELHSDAGVLAVVRCHDLVGWERGWTLKRPSGEIRCTVRALSAFPGCLWLLVDGVPVLEIRRDDLARAMRGVSPELIDAAAAAVSSSLAEREVSEPAATRSDPEATPSRSRARSTTHRSRSAYRR